MPSCNTYSLTWVSLTLDVGCCSSKAQPLLLTLDEVTLPDLECGIAPLGPPLRNHRSLDVGLLLSAAAADLGLGVARLGSSP